MRSSFTSVSVAALAVAVAVACVVGCTGLPREDQIQDMRVLAVVREPAEIVYSPRLLSGDVQGIAPTNVSVSVFAFDPRGGRVTTSIELCREDAKDEACAADRAADVLSPATTSSGVIDTHASAAGLVPVPVTTTTFDAVMLTSLLKGVAPSLATPVEPRFAVDIANRDAPPPFNEERAVARIPLTLDVGDPSAPPALVAPLLHAFHVTLCTADEEARPPAPGPVSCLRRPTANKNPELLGFVLGRRLLNGKGPAGNVFLDVTPDVDAVSVVHATAGNELRIDPVLTAASIESYQGFDRDLQTNQPTLQNRTEDIACEWFATSGDVSAPVTKSISASPRGVSGGGGGDGSLGTTFAPLSTRKAGDRDTLIAVVTDQRGGMAVGRIEVEY